MPPMNRVRRAPRERAVEPITCSSSWNQTISYVSAAVPLIKERKRTSASSVRLLLCALFFPAGSDQNTRHSVVAFVARGIEDHVAVIVGLSHFNLHRPRLGPGLGILESNLAPEIVRVNARESLDHLVGFYVRASEALREICS